MGAKMKLSHAMKLIIAKSGDANRWLPLWIHATDTAKVINEFIHLRYSSLSAIGGMSFGDFKKTAILLAYLHDIGKITPIFQSQILKSLPARRSLFEYYGIHNIPENFINKDKSHHTKCGEAILLHFGFAGGFSSVIGAHHGMPVEGLTDHIKKYPEHFYGIPEKPELWNGLHKERVDLSLEQAEFCDISEIPALSKKSQVLLSALLIMSDWVASNQINFELLEEDTILSEDEYPENRFSEAFDKAKFSESWEAFQERLSDDDFKKRFGFFMNEMQTDVISAAGNCIAPGLFILEAPMGIGKTEAALAVAEILSAKCDKSGLFFGLPSQATANGIFERVVQWARWQSYDAVHSIQLVHGNAEFQPIYVEIKDDRMLQTDYDGESGITVNSFFCGSKTSLLTDFVVATVDRILMSALKRKHVMLLHLGLSQKVVIIDECHAYDAYMNQYLDRVLAWLHEYQVPVILLSATLPLDRREKLLKAYLNNGNMLEFPNADYPRLTYTDNGKVFVKTLSTGSANKCVKMIRGDDKFAFEIIASAVYAGACIGVICNTVLRAQSFSEKARNVAGANVILYHAQYIIPDRIEREEVLKTTIGKGSDAKTRRGTVVVGTQVLEQSLDIDFDILITDLCPMDLLLQRIGRLHRHERADRPCEYRTPICIVLGTEELNKSSERIYTRWLLLRTRKLLSSQIIVPVEIEWLVNETYREIEPDNSEEKAALDAYRRVQEDKQQRAESFLMALPRESRRGNDLHHWLHNAADDKEDSALATVRDGIFSLEVLVMVQCADGMLKLLPWQTNGRKFSPDICPSDDECKKIAQQKIRLPARFCYDIDETVGELEKLDKHLTGFQKSRWLKGQLVLLLNEYLCVELCGDKVTYSQENGLTYE